MIKTNASIFLCGLACLPWKSTCITWYSHCIYWSCVTNDADVRIFSLCAATAFRKGRCCFLSECFSGCFSPPLGISRILCLMLRPLRLGLALYAVSPSQTHLFGKSLHFCACWWCGWLVCDNGFWKQDNGARDVIVLGKLREALDGHSFSPTFIVPR